MNPDILKIISLVASGATTAFLPGAAPFVNAALAGISGIQSLIANEARNRGVPPEQLAQTLIAELETSLKQTEANIADRRRRIEESK